MAVVNKFNVNGQVVDISNSDIDMTANNISYDDSFQYDENTVGDKLSKLEGEIVIYEKNVLELSIINSRYIDNTGKLVFDSSKKTYYITLTKGKTYEISVSSGKKVRFGVSNSSNVGVNLSNYNEVNEKVTVSVDEQTDGLMLCAYCETENSCNI